MSKYFAFQSIKQIVSLHLWNFCVAMKYRLTFFLTVQLFYTRTMRERKELTLSVGIVGITWWQYDWHHCFIIMRHTCCNIVFLSFILLDQQMLGFAFTGECLVLNNLHCWSGLWQHFSELVFCSCALGHFHSTMNVQNHYEYECILIAV